MLATLSAMIDQLLGLHADKLNLYQMLLRTLIVYVYIVTLLRIGDRRFFGQHAVFDGVLLIVLGSVVSRAINGQAPFFPTLGATAFLIFLHWLTAYFACKHKGFQHMVEDNAMLLVKDGEFQRENMQRVKMADNDVIEGMRLEGVSDRQLVKEGWMEANGKMSVIKRAMVVEIDVKDGVQTMRIEIGS
jgi:uncharacterized membrane protein YcaP (DUF421 family)